MSQMGPEEHEGRSYSQVSTSCGRLDRPNVDFAKLNRDKWSTKMALLGN